MSLQANVMIVAKHKQVARKLANEMQGRTVVDSKTVDVMTSYCAPGRIDNSAIRGLIEQYFSIICIYITENGEIPTLMPLLEIYASYPIKIIIYEPNVLIPKGQAPNVPKIVRKTMNDNVPAVKAIIEEIEKLNAQLMSIFKSLDKDHSGFIDANELLLAGKELGVNLTKEEAEATLKKIDKNGDNVISFEEFSFWWNSGRKLFGLSLKDIIVDKIKGSSYAQASSEAIETIGKSEDSNKVTGHFHIGLNNEETGKTQLLFKAATYGPEYNEIKKVYLPQYSQGGMEIAIIFNCRDAERGKEMINQVVDGCMALLSMMQPKYALSWEELRPVVKRRGNSVLLQIVFGGTGEIEDERRKLMEFLGIVLPIMRLSGQSIVAKLKFASDFGALSTEKRPIFTHIIEGFGIEVQTQVLKKNVDIIAAIIKSVAPMHSTIPTIILDTIVFGDVDIKFKVEDKLQEGIIKDLLQTSPELQIEAPKFKESIRAKLKGEFDDLPPFARIFIEFLRDEVISVELAGITDELAISLFVVCPGLDKLLNLD